MAGMCWRAGYLQSVKVTLEAVLEVSLLQVPISWKKYLTLQVLSSNMFIISFKLLHCL
jgi:hypothetical protein